MTSGDSTINDKTKEKRFLDALESLFTGADVEGDSGFVNLMRMKRAYFRAIRPKLMEQIDARAEKSSLFREELFDKLHTFFHRYFCESGSIYFRHLPAFFQNLRARLRRWAGCRPVVEDADALLCQIRCAGALDAG